MLAALLVLSCNKEPEHLPAGKMEEVLLDVQLAEVYSTMVPKDSALKDQGAKNPDSLAAWYGAIFRHHGVTAEQFNRSIDWYRMHPEELDSVYTRSLRRLEQMPRPAAGATPR